MAVQVKGKYRDLWAFLSQPLQRRRRIRRASSGSLPPDSLLRLTTALHPQRLELTIAQMRQETPLARTFKLVPAGTDAEGRLQRLPPFRAGQYLSLEFFVQGVRVSRPYSICCSPTETRQGNFYELTVRRREEGFVAPHIWEQWRPGTRVLIAETWCFWPGAAASLPSVRSGGSCAPVTRESPARSCTVQRALRSSSSGRSWRFWLQSIPIVSGSTWWRRSRIRDGRV